MEVTGEVTRALRSDGNWGLQNLRQQSRGSLPILKLSQFTQETGAGPRSSAEQQKGILSSCRTLQLPNLGQLSSQRDKDAWRSDGFIPGYLLGFVGNVKTLIITVKKGHQRMPCNLLPSRKQVVPIALRRSSNTPAFQTALRLWAGSLCTGFSNARHLLEQLQVSDNLL